MKRLDDAADEQHWNIALVGQGGTGKTTMGVSAPRPLILLSERQGMPSIKAAAKRMGVPMPPVLLVEEADDYRKALRALRGPRDKPFKVEGVMELPVEQWPQTVVIDSLTDACDVMVRQIRDQAPQRKGRDGLPVDAQRFWGVLIDRCVGLIKSFRDLPMNVVFLCLMSDKTKEDDDGKMLERIIQPKLATKDMANTLCAAVNVMGYTYRAMDAQKNPQYGVVTIGPEGMLTKPCEPLQKREVANLTSWIDRLNGHLEDIPAMPLAPESMEPSKTQPAKEPANDNAKEPAPDVYQCSECSQPVDSDGEICGECEAKMEAAEMASRDPAKTTEAPADPPAQREAPAMVACKHCGRRMGVKGYTEGKRRPCGESAGSCEPEGGAK